MVARDPFDARKAMQVPQIAVSSDRKHYLHQLWRQGERKKLARSRSHGRALLRVEPSAEEIAYLHERIFITELAPETYAGRNGGMSMVYVFHYSRTSFWGGGGAEKDPRADLAEYVWRECGRLGLERKFVHG